MSGMPKMCGFVIDSVFLDQLWENTEGGRLTAIGDLKGLPIEARFAAFISSGGFRRIIIEPRIGLVPQQHWGFEDQGQGWAFKGIEYYSASMIEKLESRLREKAKEPSSN